MDSSAKHPSGAQLLAFSEGHLDERELASLSSHLDVCPDCREHLRRLRGGVVSSPVAPSASAVTPSRSETRDVTVDFSGHDHAPDLAACLHPPQSPEEIGRLGSYRILKLLGRGGMGAVFVAEDLRLGRTVALKVILPDVAQRENSRERFLREARTAASIEHDHIVTIYQVDEDRGIPFIAMPLLKGQSLEDRLRLSPPLGFAQIVQIGREIASGLAAAHQHGLIHRDVKPANVWLEKQGSGKAMDVSSMPPAFRVKLLDFGLARKIEEDGHITHSGLVIGTPAYMAPEQARGETVDTRADLFSLGVVLYRMCTGKMPFTGQTAVSVLMALGAHQPPAPIQIKGDMPASLSELVMRLLEKDPDRRPASAYEVVDALRRVEKGHEDGRRNSGQATMERPVQDRTGTNAVAPSRSPRKPLWLAAAGLLALVAGLIALWNWSNDTGTKQPPDASSDAPPSIGPASISPGKPVAPAGWVKLFDGKALTGWKNAPWATSLWNVENGNLVGKGPAWLYSDKRFKNFHCRIEAKISEGGWSRFGFRNDANGNVGTPIVQGSNTGGLRLVKGKEDRVLFNPAKDDWAAPDTWLTVEVIAIDKHITVLIDGTKTAEMNVEEMSEEGQFFLSVGNDGNVMTVRKVEIKELPPSEFGARPPRWALAFDGKGAVRVPKLARNKETPVTLECWCRIDPEPAKYCALLGLGGKEGVGISYGPSASCILASQRSPPKAPGTSPVRFGMLAHVAAVVDGREARLYVDGTLQRRLSLQDSVEAPTNPFDELILGATLYGPHVGSSMTGQLREVRVSESARYDANFTPPERFTRDKDTLALYDFDEGHGDKLIDSSGNNHHGAISGARWVRVELPMKGQ